MSLADLEQYQDIGRRTALDEDSPIQYKSIEEEKRDYAIRMERRKQITVESEQIKQVWSNVQKRYIPELEWTDEMIEKEQELREFLFGN